MPQPTAAARAKDRFGEGAETSTRDGRAPQKRQPRLNTRLRALRRGRRIDMNNECLLVFIRG